MADQKQPDDERAEQANPEVADQTIDDEANGALAAAAEEPEPLPEHKDDLVALAINRGTPSYKAWAMTVPELKEALGA